MNIFMLADNMNIGGAETHIFELSRLLVSEGHSVTVFSGGGETADRLSSVGVKHFFLPNTVSTAVAKTLADRIRIEKPHIVHAHTRRRAFLCHLLSGHLDFPLVFTAHALFSVQFPLRRLSFFPSDTIAVSRDVALHLIRNFGIPKSHITVIENGVDTHRFSPHLRPHATFTVLNVSRQDRDSSLAARLLCRIAPRLQRQLAVPLRIVIVGGGNDLPTLDALARQANQTANSPIVTLLGNQWDIVPLLDGCDVFVGVSRAAMEAMAAGKPVILCGDGGYAGILRKDTLPRARKANLCARGEPQANEERLLSDLLRLANGSSEARAALGAFGRETARQYYSAEDMTRKTLAVYERARARFRASRRSDAVLCGYYGYGNCGDEMILRSIIGGQYAHENALRLAVMTADGTAPESTCGIRRYHVPSVLRELRKSGALILGGGSLLQNATSRRSLLYYLSLIRAAAHMGIPIMLYANGLGPLSPRAEAVCRKVLAEVDVISLRDRESYEAVRAMNLPHTKVLLGADPVLADAHTYPPSPVRIPRLALFPRGGTDKNEQLRLADSVAELAAALQFDVAVTAMNPKEDGTAVRRIADRIATRLPAHRHVTVSSFEPNAVVRLIDRSSLVISERLHALILAFRANVPSVGIDCDPKIGAFLREINRTSCISVHRSPQAIAFAANSALCATQDPHLARSLSARAHADAEQAFRLIMRE